MKNKKTVLIAVGGAALLLAIGGLILVSRPGRTTSTNNERQEQPEEVMPTVGASVKVDLTRQAGGQEVLLSVKGIPEGTESIDYELSYNTASQGLQGVIGTAQVDGEQEYDKQVTLGTCSSGRCVYHEVEGKIKLSLRFSGAYGDKIFESEYEL